MKRIRFTRTMKTTTIRTLVINTETNATRETEITVNGTFLSTLDKDLLKEIQSNLEGENQKALYALQILSHSEKLGVWYLDEIMKDVHWEPARGSLDIGDEDGE